MTTAHLAIGLGASSGRAILGFLKPQNAVDGAPRQVQLEEVHRFKHVGQPTPTGLIWNLVDIWRNILEGSKNELLNQFIADATGRIVTTGPAVATALGNILVQAMGFGTVKNLEELRAIVRNSFSPVLLKPSDIADQWKEHAIAAS